MYNRNRILFTPMNKIKKDDVVPELKIVNGYEIISKLSQVIIIGFISVSPLLIYIIVKF